MYFARFLIFSILLYNKEVKADFDWSDPASYYVPFPIPFPSTKDDDNTTATTIVAETETTTMKPEPDVFINNTDTTEKVDSTGWLTVENGILTAHFPETVISTTKHPHVDALNVTTNKTDTIPWYSRHTKSAEYIPWYLKSNTTATTTRDSDTTTSTEGGVNYNITTLPPPWFISRYHRNSTPWYVRTTTQSYPSWLPRTRRPAPHRHPWRCGNSILYNTTEKPSWDSNRYYDNTTWSSSDIRTPVFDYSASLNSNRNNTNQTTGEDPDGSCKSCNPVNISINSKINQSADGETANYGTFVNFLKKIVGKVIPSAINIAPNSNATNNVAVASGNGNMFFYVYN